jgi:hypothetical protein
MRVGTRARAALLCCGLVAALLYVEADLLAAVRCSAYHRFASQAISELSAVGAPTKPLVDPFLSAFALLLGAFGLGVRTAAGRCRRLRLMGGLLVIIGILCLLWPPMYLRGTGGFSRDLPHMGFGAVVFGLVTGVVGLGSSLGGRRFQVYSRGTLAVVVIAGALSAFEAIRLELGQPTAWIGISERIGVGAALLWVAGLARRLLRSPQGKRSADI